MKIRLPLLLLLVLLHGCSQQVSNTRSAPLHTVQKGETLYAIAWRYNLNYVDLSRWNKVPEPYTIYPGQKLRLSGAQGPRPATSLLRLPEPPVSTSTQTTKRAPPPTAKPVQKPRAKPAQPVPKPASRQVTASKPSPSPSPAPGSGNWRWPTKGKVVKQFDTGRARLLGVAIAGNVGQPIRASASGRVVYSGKGIPSYGQLLIVKHDNTFLSAYAHNSRLLVSEGSVVKAGQKIAEMGRDPDQQAVLHFEIRKHGKPVDPLRYLTR